MTAHSAPIKAVFFDIGETLINETRAWSALADWLEVPRMTLFGVLGGLITEGRDHRELFDIVRPDIGWEGVVRRYHAEGRDFYLPEDLYADAIPTLRALRERGFLVGVAGNQPVEREKDLRAMQLPADLLATSGGWGLKKPSPEFFERLVREAHCRPEEIAYVGDRVDNDVVPAAAAGLIPVHVIRGPWGFLHRNWPDASRARWQVRSLTDIPVLLRQS